MGSESTGFGKTGRADFPYPKIGVAEKRRDEDESEFGWSGGGLVPKGLENASTREGGRYKGKSPDMENIVTVSRDTRG